MLDSCPYSGRQGYVVLFLKNAGGITACIFSFQNNSVTFLFREEYIGWNGELLRLLRFEPTTSSINHKTAKGLSVSERQSLCCFYLISMLTPLLFLQTLLLLKILVFTPQYKPYNKRSDKGNKECICNNEFKHRASMYNSTIFVNSKHSHKI